jgi:hypothetical protein
MTAHIRLGSFDRAALRRFLADLRINAFTAGSYLRRIGSSLQEFLNCSVLSRFAFCASRFFQFEMAVIASPSAAFGNLASRNPASLDFKLALTAQAQIILRAKTIAH